MSVVGVLAWLGVGALFGALEWWGLRRKHDHWPPATEVLKSFMHKRTDPRWWLVLGLYLWLGVHFFLQGWSA